MQRLKKSQWVFRTRQGNLWFAGIVTLFGLLGTVLFNLMDVQLSGILYPCILNTITGYRCPACGGTRAMEHLMHLDIGSAFYYNPFFILVLFGLVALFAAFLFNALLLREYRPLKVQLSVPAALIFCGSVIAFLVVRNLPFYRAIFY